MLNNNENKNLILCGMYDRTCIPHMKDLLYKSIVPESTKEYQLSYNDMGFLEIEFSRKDFPFNNPDGTKKNYYGWYVIIPVDKETVFLNENNGSPMNTNSLKFKNEDGSDLIIIRNNIRYYVFGKFNVAKTSDNWSMKVITM